MKNLSLILVATFFALFFLTSCQKEALELEDRVASTPELKKELSGNNLAKKENLQNSIRDTINTSSRMAQSRSGNYVNYVIKVRTKREGGGGTDNDVYMNLYGTKNGNPSSGWFFVEGNLEQGQEEYTILRDIPDLGNIYELQVDVNGQLADRWSLEWVKVYANVNEAALKEETPNLSSDNYDGYYFFRPNKEMSYSQENFSPDQSIHPKVYLDFKTDGNLHTADAKNIQVHMDYNGLGIAQDLMDISESWTSIERVGASLEKATSLAASATLNYESPETVAGKFGASVTASWGQTITGKTERANEFIKESIFGWKVHACGNSMVLKKRISTTPYMYQAYKAEGKTVYVKTLNNKISSYSEVIEIPARDKNCEISSEPVSWSKIEKDFLPYLDKNQKEELLSRKADWLRAGYIIETPSMEEIANKVFQIEVKATGTKLHEDGGSDKLISTRYQPNDDFTRFIFKPAGKNTFTIKVKQHGRHLHEDGSNDKLVSTRYQPGDSHTKFILEPQDDGSFRIKVKANHRYLRLGSNKLLSTKIQKDDDYSRFYLK